MQGLAMKCRVGGTPAKSDELRKNLYEAILLLTRTRIGREFLRGAKVYPVRWLGLRFRL